MSKLTKTRNSFAPDLKADCSSCFGLCCTALPFAKSADFAFDKESGCPCPNLQSDYKCSIHRRLREKGFRGCAVYECFGAGQKVSQIIFKGKDWREQPESAEEMFAVFPVVQQLHEMLVYLNQALQLQKTETIHPELRDMFMETEAFTLQNPQRLLDLDITGHRQRVNKLLLKTSKMVRTGIQGKNAKSASGRDFIGAPLQKADLAGANLRGALLIAADLREANLRFTDFIGADLRDAHISGADLTGSIFLTQAQINAAKGNIHTKLPSYLYRPDHWHV